VYWTSVEEADAALATLLQLRHMAPTSATRLEHLGGVVAVFQLPTQALADEARELVRKDFPAATVDFNTRYRPLFQPSPQPRIYLPQKIDQPTPGSNPLGGAGVRVGIVDGPVARSAALNGVKVFRKSFLSNTDIAAPVGHATSIAALIAGQDLVAGFVGIAPHANLYSAEIMRSLGPDDLTSSAALIHALDWLLAEKVQLINLSLGGPGDLVMEKAFAKLATQNVVVIAAAGNGGPTAVPSYPAAYPGVIAVTATDAADKLYVQANRGSYITLAAPGVDLWVPDTELGHYVSGTSFSAAVVTGASALLLAQNPPPNNKASMPQRLCRGAKDLGTRGADAMYGCGLIQIGALLREDRS
jgi:subtilisin family serine protease